MTGRLRIGFDAKRLFHNFTGLGNYSRTLVANLAQAFPEQEYFLFTPTINYQERTKPFIGNPRYSVITPRGSSLFWRSRGIRRELLKYGIHIYHGLSHEIPQKSDQHIRSVVTIHDLIFKYFPGDYNRIDRWIYDRKCRYACTHADAIVAISQQTKLDIIKFYQIPEEKIQVIYQTCDARFSIDMSDHTMQEVRRKYALPSQFILHVGSIIRRKNLGLLIEAMHRMNKADRLPLVILGNGGKYKQEIHDLIRKYQLGAFVIFPGDVTFSDFPAIYKMSEMLVYPSLHEGFGIPVIEAQASGIPVITSNQSSLKEAAGKGAYLIDPHDPDALSNAIRELMHDPVLRRRIISAGNENMNRFASDLLSKQLMQLYRNIE